MNKLFFMGLLFFVFQEQYCPWNHKAQQAKRQRDEAEN